MCRHRGRVADGGKGANSLIPHLADEAGLGLRVVHALPAGHGGRVVAALLRRQVGEEAGRSL